MQKIIISGTLGKDAEVKDHNGRNVMSFSVAVDASYVKDGAQESPQFPRQNMPAPLKFAEKFSNCLLHGPVPLPDRRRSPLGKVGEVSRQRPGLPSALRTMELAQELLRPGLSRAPTQDLQTSD